MFLATAALLASFSFPQMTSPTVNDSAPAVAAEDVAKTDAAKSDSTTSASLPSAPSPKIAADNAAARESSSLAAEPIQPAAGVQPVKPPKYAIRTRMETPTQRATWIGLSVLGHGTAAFDAYSTRQALSCACGTESNPLLRPFAHSSAIYAATQVSPTVMDFLGHKMMKSRSPMIRKMWWVPQAAGAGFSFAAGMHNMGVVK
jgi:hypothetical protein